MVWPRKDRTWTDAGRPGNTVMPAGRHQQWHNSAAAHQQNGQRCGEASGRQDTQKPADVGTTVGPTWQTWFGRVGRDDSTRHFYRHIRGMRESSRLIVPAPDYGDTEMHAGASADLCDLDLGPRWGRRF